MFDFSEFKRIAPEWSSRLHYHEQISSTSDEAHRLASEGAPHGTLVIAEQQTSGRGRRGAVWLSEPGDGLLFSIIIRPKSSREGWSRLALTAGLGIATCLNSEWSVPAELKWPNDIYIEGKKCCGILLESSSDYVVVGIGLNVAYSPEGNAFTSVWEHLGKPIAREELLYDILTAVWRELDDEQAFTEQLVRLRKLCLLTGKVISFISQGEQYSGKFIKIGETGEMLVKIDGQTLSYLNAEQIRIV